MRETDEIAEKMLLQEKTKQQRNIEIAKNAILEGSTNEFIAKITGLTVKQIKTLRNEKE